MRAVPAQGRAVGVGGRSVVRGGAIPDSVVSRDSDTGSSSNNLPNGIEVTVSQSWPKFQARISSSSQPQQANHHAQIYTMSGGNIDTKIADVDISSMSAGDVVTFTESDLSQPLDNNNYGILYKNVDGGEHYSGRRSFNGPHTSSDGNLEISNGLNTASSPDNSASIAYGFDKVGNISL